MCVFNQINVLLQSRRPSGKTSCSCFVRLAAACVFVVQRQAAASRFDQIRKVVDDSGRDCFTSVVSCMLHHHHFVVL